MPSFASLRVMVPTSEDAAAGRFYQRYWRDGE
jgi:hypothetical protein